MLLYLLLMFVTFLLAFILINKRNKMMIEFLVFIFGTALLASSILLIVNHADDLQEYNLMFYQREILIDRLEKNDPYVYTDIYDYNSTLAKNNETADNIWIGIFFNRKLKDIDYIVLR